MTLAWPPSTSTWPPSTSNCSLSAYTWLGLESAFIYLSLFGSPLLLTGILQPTNTFPVPNFMKPASSSTCLDQTLNRPRPASTRPSVMSLGGLTVHFNSSKIQLVSYDVYLISFFFIVCRHFQPLSGLTLPLLDLLLAPHHLSFFTFLWPSTFNSFPPTSS